MLHASPQSEIKGGKLSSPSHYLLKPWIFLLLRNLLIQSGVTTMSVLEGFDGVMCAQVPSKAIWLHQDRGKRSEISCAAAECSTSIHRMSTPISSPTRGP